MKLIKLFATLTGLTMFMTGYAQTDSTSAPASGDTTAPKKVDSAAIKEKNREEVMTFVYEAIIVGDSTYQVRLGSCKNEHYLLSVFSSSRHDSALSLIKLTSGTTLPVFRNVLFELLNKITSKTMQDMPEVELQASQLYDRFFTRMRIENSSEVKELSERLSTYEGLLDEKFKYGGVIRIRKDTIPTYRRFIREVRKNKIRSINKACDAVLDQINKLQKAETEAREGADEERIQYYVEKNESHKVAEKRKTDSARDLNNQIEDYRRVYDSLTILKKAIKHNYEKTDGIFIVDSVFIEFFNSTVDKLMIYGKYARDSSEQAIKEIHFNEAPIRAYNRSFGLRGLNNNDYFFTVNSGSVNEYAIKIRELLQFTKIKNNFAYIIKDQSLSLTRDSARVQTLERRALYDYLSLITFVDFLGISNAVNNNYIQIEGRARFPLKLSTIIRPYLLRNASLLPMFEMYVNGSFINGNNASGRKADISMTEARDTLFYDHFDLMRNYNVKAGLSLGLFSLQYKGIHSRIYGAVDLKMYRTSFSMTRVNTGLDSTVQSNVFSLSWSPTIIFEYRPDFNIGADIRFSVDCNLSPLNFRSNELNFLPSKGPIFNGDNKYKPITSKQRTIYGLEINAYSFLSPQKEKNDGIYFRMAIFTNRNITDISPYIMAGYATSLKGLVKTNKGETRK